MAGDDDFLSRWSRRKSESKDPSRSPAPEPVRDAATVAVAPPAPAADAADAADRAPLPPVDSLTPESDFTPFMAPEVDADLRRQALKTLFSDPRFNVMDMMDVYVDDYSKPDPIPESWMGKLEQLSRLGDRAGRDREEAERRKALADAQAANPDASANTPPELASTAEALEPAGGAGGDATGECERETPPPVIPTPAVRE